STKSGPSSLESTRITKTVTPRAPSGQQTAGSLTSQFLGSNGAPVAVGAVPGIDASTGIFAGPMPPTDGITVGLAAFLPQVLNNGALTVKIDSVTMGMAAGLGPAGRSTLYYLTAVSPTGTLKLTIPLDMDAFEGNNSVTVPFRATAIDSAKSVRYGGDQSF